MPPYTPFYILTYPYILYSLGCSTVPGYEEQSRVFLSDMQTMGVTITTTEKVMGMLQGVPCGEQGSKVGGTLRETLSTLSLLSLGEKDRENESGHHNNTYHTTTTTNPILNNPLLRGLRSPARSATASPVPRIINDFGEVVEGGEEKDGVGDESRRGLGLPTGTVTGLGHGHGYGLHLDRDAFYWDDVFESGMGMGMGSVECCLYNYTVLIVL